MRECPERLGRTTTDYLIRNKICRTFCDGIMHGIVKARPHPHGESQDSRFEVYFLEFCPKHGTSNVRKIEPKMTFESFEKSLQPAAYQAAISFCDAIPGQNNMILGGPNGTGKTHLATAIYEHVRAKHGAHFTTWRKLVDVLQLKDPDYKCSWDDRDIARGEYRKMIRDRLVVIDDMCQRTDGVNEFVRDEFAGMLDEMDGQFVITTNRTPDELERDLGKTVADRLFMRTGYVVMDGTNYRRGGAA